MIIIDDDGRYSCNHAFVEETDYDWFSSTDGEKVVLPVDDEKNIIGMPVVMCFVDDNGVEVQQPHGCLGKKHCKFYQKAKYEMDNQSE